MNIYKYILGIFVCFSFMLQSCEKIELDEFFIGNKGGIIDDKEDTGDTGDTGDGKNEFITDNSGEFFYNFKETNITPACATLSVQVKNLPESSFGTNGAYRVEFTVANKTYEANQNGSKFSIDLNTLDASKTYSYTASIVLKSSSKDYQTSVAKTFTTVAHVPAEAVDLGLSVKWASYDVGALAENSLVSGLYPFDYEDIATLWGDSWRTPTKEECDELYKNCTIQYVGGITSSSSSAASYYKITGPNGKYIYMNSNIKIHSYYNSFLHYYWLTGSGYSQIILYDYDSYHYRSIRYVKP